MYRELDPFDLDLLFSHLQNKYVLKELNEPLRKKPKSKAGAKTKSKKRKRKKKK